jgi:outer membrane receptor protein involved in Fe transport
VFANSQAGPSFKPFKSSKLWNYEVGFRSDWFGGRVRWDTTVFDLVWKDLQLTVSVPLVPEGDNVGLTTGIIENVGAARSQGVETGLTFQIARGLSWNTNAAWINAVTTELFTDQNGTVQPGTRLPASSRFQLANIVSYARPLPYFESWGSALSVTHAYLGPAYNDLQYSRRQGGYDTIDATFSIAEQRSRFKPEISVGLRNMLDARGIAYVSHVSSGTASVAYEFIPPRMAVFSIGFKY